MRENFELKIYASRPVHAVQITDVNTQALELLDLFGADSDTIRIHKYNKKSGENLIPAVRLKVLTGRGNAKVWRPCHDGDWIIREHDGAMRVFRDRSFKNTFEELHVTVG